MWSITGGWWSRLSNRFVFPNSESAFISILYPVFFCDTIEVNHYQSIFLFLRIPLTLLCTLFQYPRHTDMRWIYNTFVVSCHRLHLVQSCDCNWTRKPRTSSVAVTSPSDLAPASSKDLLDIQATIECGFTLKRVPDMTRTYSSSILLTFSNDILNNKTI